MQPAATTRHAGVGVGVGLWGPKGDRAGAGKAGAGKGVALVRGKSPPSSPPRQILAKSTEMIRQSSLTRLGCIINTAVNGGKRSGTSRDPKGGESCHHHDVSPWMSVSLIHMEAELAELCPA